ncbi:hypothetical protein EUA06_20575 [Nocardioides glacieisoli]|uniref:Uncharacterized protein n=1 Tax=Nocardioides glacieisoli TaxID=1168730 RepID=A0A4Q2RN56_9ACTN|nr:hypothetical protein [Nocardioides glacieisoli]RYB88533.1 hypothetical protein EUA06_20575 [Nocardioides glacieisoli]
MTRTITVSQPGLVDSSLSLSEAGAPDGTFAFRGLLKRSAQLDLTHQRLTFTTLGLLGRTVRAAAADGSTVGEFQQTGILGRGDAEVNGRRYRLKVSGVLWRRYQWVAADGTEAMWLKLGGFLRTTGTIGIRDTAVPDDAAALIGLGLIARRALESDSGGGAAAAAAS